MVKRAPRKPVAQLRLDGLGDPDVLDTVDAAGRVIDVGRTVFFDDNRDGVVTKVGARSVSIRWRSTSGKWHTSVRPAVEVRLFSQSDFGIDYRKRQR